ncbi:MAG: hypothetical protein L0287_36245 [Anaerolineae bacterium]|nr:hypothetical protein [Anaerolineae bacterium]MCI0609635.1 hypothetical protein [Anaerolineae bacterium]
MSTSRYYSLLILPILFNFIFQLLPNLFSSWLESNFGQTSTKLIGIISFLLVTGTILWAVNNAIHQKRNWVLVSREQQPPRFPGLVLLMGMGTGKSDPRPFGPSQGPAIPSIEYHLAGSGKNRLHTCWLITSRDGVSAAEALRSHYESSTLRVHVCIVKDPFGLQDTYELVRNIYLKEAFENKLKPEQIISDFTGSTRPMMAGMVLACGEQWPMQYMSKKGDSPSMPIQIKFQPAD